MIITPMVRNNVCMNAHPVGCEIMVRRQVEHVSSRPAIEGPRRVLILGASTGYGLASRIVAAYGCGAETIGVFYERPGSEKRTGSSGWYNDLAFAREASESGIWAESINGDAFSDEVKDLAASVIRERWGVADLVVYSLAAPVRRDPRTGVTYRSVIKPIGETFKSLTVDPMSEEVTEVTIEPAALDEIDATVKVMGGEDWSQWIRHLLDQDVLATGATTLAYSYIGPEATRPLYREGTIGRAKEDLERTARELDTDLELDGGRALVSVNKALITRASAVIPVVPMYVSLLYRIMKEKGLHENCIGQIYRLFADKLFADADIPVDSAGRIRMDDREMRADVQERIERLWKRAGSPEFGTIADLATYRRTFLQFHGFDVDGVDYGAEVTP